MSNHFASARVAPELLMLSFWLQPRSPAGLRVQQCPLSGSHSCCIPDAAKRGAANAPGLGLVLGLRLSAACAPHGDKAEAAVHAALDHPWMRHQQTQGGALGWTPDVCPHVSDILPAHQPQAQPLV